MARDALPPYRVMTRLQAFAFIGVVLALSAVVVWLGNGWIAVHVERIDTLRTADSQAAIAAMVAHLKLLALVQIPPLAAFTAFMVWYCRRAIDSQSLPPAGAWIVAGQRIRTGPGAVRSARILLSLTGVVAILGSIAVLYVYYVAVSLQTRGT